MKSLRILALFVMLAGFAACGGETDSGATANTLQRGLPSDPETLDHHKARSTQAAEVLRDLGEGLAGFTANGELVPAAAERWDISDDGLTYTFYLRPGVKFHTGQEVTANDVKFTFERLYDPELASPASFFGTFIVGATDKLEGNVTEVEGIKVIDDYTIEFTLSEPYGAFLAELVTPSLGILSQEEVEKWGLDYGVHPSGTGPFKLQDWVRGEKLVLVETGRRLGPFISLFPLLPGVVVNSPHGVQVENDRVELGKEVVRNRGEVEVDSIAPGQGVDAEEARVAGLLKRAVDLTLASLMLLVLALPMVVMAILLRLLSLVSSLLCDVCAFVLDANSNKKFDCEPAGAYFELEALSSRGSGL